MNTDESRPAQQHPSIAESESLWQGLTSRGAVREGTLRIGDLTITTTSSGVVLSGTVRSSSDLREVVLAIEHILAGQEGGRGGQSSPIAVVQGAEPTFGEAVSDDLERGGGDSVEVLNWDNLIPVPPNRPGGRVRVKLKKLGRDTPFPAEDPWAK